jgi:hypothetical protein
VRCSWIISLKISASEILKTYSQSSKGIILRF